MYIPTSICMRIHIDISYAKSKLFERFEITIKKQNLPANSVGSLILTIVSPLKRTLRPKSVINMTSRPRDLTFSPCTGHAGSVTDSPLT